MTSSRIELLAPAKDLDCGRAAIDCGADAVYIGAARFGAREDAGNALADIEALVAHAHKFRARIYATVNTLLKDDELPTALRLIRSLYEIGVDALIVQDVGLLECDLPPLPLIASTQMHNATPERVAFLESVGFSRAILARELSLAEIAEIRRRTTLELECFIHGALVRVLQRAVLPQLRHRRGAAATGVRARSRAGRATRWSTRAATCWRGTSTCFPCMT